MGIGDNMTKLKKVTIQIVTVVILASTTLKLLTAPVKKVLYGRTLFANKHLVFTASYTKIIRVFLKYRICNIDQLYAILVGGL